MAKERQEKNQKPVKRRQAREINENELNTVVGGHSHPSLSDAEKDMELARDVIQQFKENNPDFDLKIDMDLKKMFFMKE